MKGTLFVIMAFALGVITGVFNLFPSLFSDDFSSYILCILIFSIGLGLGHNKTILSDFSKLNWRIITIPILTIIGTYIGIIVISPLIQWRSLSELLAVGSGFGYYSLSSMFITEYKGEELGTIALVSNIIREIATLLLAPLLVKYFGKWSTISAGGATTLDTTLPTITKYSGNEFVIIAIFHGLFIDISTPFLVTFFCKI